MSKKIYKSWLSLTLVIIMLFAVVLQMAYASPVGTIRTTVTAAEPLGLGDNFTVTLHWDGTSGFWGMILYVYVPEGLAMTHARVGNTLLVSALTGPCYEWNPLANNGMIPTPVTGNYASFVWYRTSALALSDFDLLILTFEVTGDAAGVIDGMYIEFPRGLPVGATQADVIDVALADDGMISPVEVTHIPPTRLNRASPEDGEGEVGVSGMIPLTVKLYPAGAFLGGRYRIEWDWIPCTENPGEISLSHENGLTAHVTGISYGMVIVTAELVYVNNADHPEGIVMSSVSW